MRRAFGALALFVPFLLLATHGVRADSSWLDNSLVPWNTPGMAVPSAPPTIQVINPECDPTARPVELAEDQQLVDAGWKLVGAYQGGWGVNLIIGTSTYDDTGGPGPVVVLVHGLLMDGVQWRHVVADLRRDHRCVLPTLPMGAHRRPMRPEADLSLRGLEPILTEFMERLDLRDVTLCFNDWYGAQVMIADGGVERVGRLVLVSCEAFENYPPGLPGRLAGLAARVPGGVVIMRRTLLSRRLRQLPLVFGSMSKRGIPDAIMRAWLQPLARREIRRDYCKYAGDTARGKRDLLAATGALATFDRPVLVAWATEDRLMPREHGRRLTQVFPNSQLVEIPDSFTLVPEDQPAVLAAHLRGFIAGDRPAAGS